MTRPKDVLTVGLLWHSVNSGNLGVGALTISQIAIARAAGARVGVDLRFRVLGWQDSGASYVPDAEVVGFRYKDVILPGGALSRTARSCDVVLDIGTGDGFADIYGVKRALSGTLSKLIVRLAGRPLILSPQTVGPFSRSWTRRLAARALRAADSVFTRDALSTAYVREIAPGTRVTEATDVAFRLPYERRDFGLGNGRARVGINVSGLLYNRGYTGGNEFGLKADYAALMREMVGRFAARPDCEVHLVPHVLAEEMPVEDDRRVAREIAEAHPGVIVAPRFASPSEAKSYIAGLDFFTGSRMHACIAAFSSGVPVVPLAYSRKFAGLFGTLGYDQTIDCRTEDAPAILAAVEAGFERRAELAATVRPCLAESERRLDIYEAALREVFAAAGQGAPAKAAARPAGAEA